MTALNNSFTLIQEKIASFQAALLEKHPRIPTLLQEIHQALKAQPENVTLLSEDEIRVVVNGLEHHTNTFLAQSVVSSKSKQGSTARLKNLSEDDI